MPVMHFAQRSLFDPQNIAPGVLSPSSLAHLLHAIGDDLVPGFLRAEWRGAGKRGRPAWPAARLLALQLLRWSEGGGGRLGACERAKTDLAWRAAMRLPAFGPSPTEKTLREFEHWLMGRTDSCDLRRYEVLFEGLTLRASGVLSEATWVMDGTPMYCFGALQGTVRMLGDGLRGLLRRWGRVRGGTLAQVAQRLDVPWVAAKSIKGGLAADWSDPESRRDALGRLVRDVIRIVAHVESKIHEVSRANRTFLLQRCRDLLRVIEKDIRVDDDGHYFVQWKAGDDRLVSITEPEARSGHKSKQSKFKGFKLTILGDLVSGLIAAVKVFEGNQAEGRHGVELLERAKRLELSIDRALGDSAYGGTPTRMAIQRLGIELVAPPPAIQLKDDAPLQKHEFDVDFKAQTATCPAGVTTADHRMGPFEGELRSVYEWPLEACRGCHLRAACVPKMRDDVKPRGQRPKGRRLKLDVNERELRRARAEWPGLREEYRRRGQGERLVARMVRLGSRQARAFGLAAANLQVHLIAIANNLSLLATRLQGRAPEQPTLPLWRTM
ncbi:MAG: transposase [Myxococcota bacterium]